MRSVNRNRCADSFPGKCRLRSQRARFVHRSAVFRVSNSRSVRSSQLPSRLEIHIASLARVFGAIVARRAVIFAMGFQRKSISVLACPSGRERARNNESGEAEHRQLTGIDRARNGADIPRTIAAGRFELPVSEPAEPRVE